MRFGSPDVLKLFYLIIPLLLYLGYRTYTILRNISRGFAGASASKLGIQKTMLPHAIRLLLLSAAFALLTLALARPQGKPIKSEENVKGIDIMLTIDVSSSMAAVDMNPNRMEVIKEGVKNFLATLDGDRVGIVTFAGVDFTQCPLTVDYDAAALIVDSLYPGMLYKDGTALGAAINASLARLKEKGGKSRIMVLITDGESTEGESPISAARKAKEEGIRVYTIGVGTAEGGSIPDSRDMFGRMYYKTYKGEVVVSKLDDAELKQVAGITGGKYYRITDKSAFSKITDDIRFMEENDTKVKKKTIYEENYWVFLLWGLVFFVAAGFPVSIRRDMPFRFYTSSRIPDPGSKEKQK